MLTYRELLRVLSDTYYGARAAANLLYPCLRLAKSYQTYDDCLAAD